MNLKSKAMLIVLLILVAALAAGCSQEATPYEINDAAGYNVSVKFDANGGTLTNSYDSGSYKMQAYIKGGNVAIKASAKKTDGDI